MAYGDLKYSLRMAYRRHPAISALVAVNVGVAVICWITGFVALAAGKNLHPGMWLSVPSSGVIMRPWTVLTFMFTQTNVFHLLFNMLWLYWFGIVLADAGGDRKVVRGYVAGGIAGAVAFIIFAGFAPSLSASSLSGASASVVAIMVESALKRPDMRFRLLLIGTVRLKWLALMSLLLLLLGFGGGNAGGQAAHIGGVVSGLALWLIDTGRIPLPKHEKRRKADRIIKVMESRRQGMERLDELLDKIKVSGYDSLTKQEKRELDRLSSR